MEWRSDSARPSTGGGVARVVMLRDHRGDDKGGGSVGLDNITTEDPFPQVHAGKHIGNDKVLQYHALIARDSETAIAGDVVAPDQAPRGENSKSGIADDVEIFQGCDRLKTLDANIESGHVPILDCDAVLGVEDT